MSDSSRPHGLQPTRLLRPWDLPGKSIGVGWHHLLCMYHIVLGKFCHLWETQLPQLKNRNDATPGQPSHEDYMGFLLAHNRPLINAGCGNGEAISEAIDVKEGFLLTQAKPGHECLQVQGSIPVCTR